MTIAFFSSKRHLSFVSLVAGFVALSAMALPRDAHALMLVVDADGRGSATDCNALDVAFSSIQAAINVAVMGDTIFVCPGTYADQLVITKSDLTILGSGAGATVLRPSVVSKNTTSLL